MVSNDAFILHRAFFPLLFQERAYRARPLIELQCHSRLGAAYRSPGPQLTALSAVQGPSRPTFWITGSAVGSFINYDSLAVSNGLQMEVPVESPQGS